MKKNRLSVPRISFFYGVTGPCFPLFTLWDSRYATLFLAALLFFLPAAAHAANCSSPIAPTGSVQIQNGTIVVCGTESTPSWDTAFSISGASGAGSTLFNVGYDSGSCTSAKEGELSNSSGTLQMCHNGSWSSIASEGTAAIAPSFSANNGSSTQAVTAGTWAKMTLGTVAFDTINGWSATNNRYTPTVAGKYLVTGDITCASTTTGCSSAIYKNGAMYAVGTQLAVSTGSVISPATAIIDMNGTTDYVELWAYDSNGTAIGNQAYDQYLSVALIAPLVSGSVAGTGTASYVPEWSSSTTLTNSPIAISSGNVGIGTTSPSWPLHMNGSGYTGLLMTNSSSGTGSNAGFLIDFGDGGSGVNAAIWNYNNGYIRLGTDNSEAMRITSSGNVGIGTTSPAAPLHVAGNSSGWAIFVDPAKTAGASGPGFALGENGGVSAIQTFAQANLALLPSGGNVGIGTTSPGANLDVIGATNGNAFIVRDSTSGNAGLVVKPKAAGNGVEVQGTNQQLSAVAPLSLNPEGGLVGIGTSSPGVQLEVNGEIAIPNGSWLQFHGPGGGYDGGIYEGSGGGINFVAGSAGVYYFNANNNSTLYATINSNGVQNGSDRRLKQDIHPIEDALGKITQITGVTFHWKDPIRGKDEQVGVIAQDVQKVFPQVVGKDPHGFLTVNYGALVAPVIQAVKEQQGEIKEIKADNDNLKANNDNQAAAITELRQEVAELKKEIRGKHSQAE